MRCMTSRRVYCASLKRMLTGKIAVFATTIQVAGSESDFVVAALSGRRYRGVMATRTQIPL